MVDEMDVVEAERSIDSIVGKGTGLTVDRSAVPKAVTMTDYWGHKAAE